MKNIILKSVLLFLCVNCLAQKKNSSNENFTFQDGNEKIVFENIDPKTVSISGKTIRYFYEPETKENEILIIMSPKSEDLENDKLKVSLSYFSVGKSKNSVFCIPVEKK